MIVHTEQWGGSASSAGMLRLKPSQQACNRAELTPPWPFFGNEPLFTVCDAGSKGRGEGNHSHILSLCALIHRGSCLYTLIWLRQSRGETEQKEGRETGQGKQNVFIFLYILYVKVGFVGHVWRNGSFLLLCVYSWISSEQLPLVSWTQTANQLFAKWLDHLKKLKRSGLNEMENVSRSHCKRNETKENIELWVENEL